MDKGAATKLAIGAAVFGALFMLLWILGGILISSLSKTPESPGSPSSGDFKERNRKPAAPAENAPAPVPVRPSGPALAHAARLVESLSSDSYETRRDAEESLVAMGANAVPELEKAARSNDHEVRWRAAEAIRRIRESGR